MSHINLALVHSARVHELHQCDVMALDIKLSGKNPFSALKK